jgi:hypothetical protein
LDLNLHGILTTIVKDNLLSVNVIKEAYLEIVNLLLHIYWHFSAEPPNLYLTWRRMHKIFIIESKGKGKRTHFSWNILDWYF